MCISIKSPPIPEPEPIPVKAKVTTSQKAPASAGRNINVTDASSKKQIARGTLRIPLSSLGTRSGLNLPTA